MKFSWTKIILTLIILFNSVVFGLYGLAKLIGLQFAYKALPSDLLLKDVPPLALMWKFYAVKREYAILVAFAEIIPAILILFKRTRFLGAIMYLFSAANILAINIIFGLTIQTLILSIVIFVNTLIIIYSERQKLQTLLS